MEIKTEKTNDVVILNIIGNLDSNTSGMLEETLIPAIGNEKTKIIIDCSQMGYISSAGLRVLLMAAKKSKHAGGVIVLCALKDHIKEVFDIAGFTAIFSIMPTRTEALAKCA